MLLFIVFFLRRGTCTRRKSDSCGEGKKRSKLMRELGYSTLDGNEIRILMLHLSIKMVAIYLKLTLTRVFSSESKSSGRLICFERDWYDIIQ